MPQDEKPKKKLPVVAIVAFVAVFGLIAFLATRQTFARYSLAESALKSGHAGVAAAALAPEIGSGIHDLLS